MVGKEDLKERPVFIPPRKRQSTKKINGTQNYVDHIVSVQSRQKPSPTSPGLEDALLKTSLLLKNKQPLPQIPKPSLNNSQTNLSNNDIFELIEDSNELQTYENISSLVSISQPPNNNSRRGESSTVTPSSYSESSIDVKLSKSQDCLTTRSSSKKRVNIRTDNVLQQAKSPNNRRNSHENTTTPTAITNYEDLESNETSVVNTDEHSLDRYCTRRSTDSYLTMTGTIKRGRKKGQSVDLQINMSREELEKINAAALAAEVTKKRNLCCVCTLTTGFHILLLSILCLPFIALITSIYSFYIGTLTWYNMFTYFNEEKSYLHKLIMSPLLILAYPFGILICTIGLGIYAGCIQISLQLTSWLNEICDIEKGFYGWLCAILRLSDCSPYEVVILTDLKLPPEENINTHSSTEELSL